MTVKKLKEELDKWADDAEVALWPPQGIAIFPPDSPDPEHIIAIGGDDESL